MSSIVIAGDTSGTVTLQAPAVAGSTTVNLPSTPGNNGASAVVTTDSSGNLGLGVTPSANWQSARRALQISATAGGASIHSAANSQAVVGANNVFNGTNYLYLASDTASRYEQLFGAHAWYTAPSGTAGNAISFTQAMTLDASGRLGIGTTSPSTRLHVDAPATTGNVDALTIGNNSNNENDAVSCVWLLGGSRKATIQAIQPGSSATVLTFNTQISGGSFGERARIDSSGNLLVGTTTANTNFPGIQVGTTSSGKNLLITSSSNGNNGLIQFVGSDGSNSLQVGAGTTSVDFYGYRNTPMRFFTNAAERVRITGDGNFGIGTASPGVRLDVVGSGRFYSPSSNTSLEVGRQGDGIYYNSIAIWSGYNGSVPSHQWSQGYLGQSYTTSGTLYIAAGGSNGVYLAAGGTSWTSNSDIRLKNVISPIESPLSKVMQLDAFIFSWKNDPEGKRVVGLSAQTVEAVLPEAVSKSRNLKDESDNTEYLGVQYTDVIPLLTAAIQELNAKVEALTAELNTLKGQA